MEHQDEHEHDEAAVGTTLIDAPPDAADVHNGEVLAGGDTFEPIPEAVEKAAEGIELDEEEMLDATAWLLADEDEILAEVAPTTVRFTLDDGRKIEWKLRPLSPEEFKECRGAAMGTKKQQQQKINRGDLVGLMDENKYHLLVVTQATVYPNLAEAARRKGVHPTAIVQHRFRFKPGWIAELASTVSDISGYDPSKFEVVAEAAAGNS